MDAVAEKRPLVRPVGRGDRAADGNRSTTVVGAVGRIGSGKDSLVDYLAERYGVTALSIGDVVRRVAVWRGIPTTRENLQQISEQLKEHKGPAVFVRHVIRQIDRGDWDAVAVSGIRSPNDAGVFREHYGAAFVLVLVAVDDRRLRFQRLKARDEPRDPQSFAEFEAQERDEEEEFRIGATLALADLTIRNDGSIEELHRRIDEQLVPRLGLQS